LAAADVERAGSDQSSGQGLVSGEVAGDGGQGAGEAVVVLADEALVFLERSAMGLARLEGPRQAPGPRWLTGRRFGRRSHGGSRRWSIRCQVASRGDRLPQSKCTTFATPQHGAAREGDTLGSLFYAVAPFLRLSGRRLYKLGLTS